MIDDQIKQFLLEIKKLRLELRNIKKDLKFEEKIDTPEYLDLEKAYKDMRKQMKDLKEEWTKELQSDNDYNQLREIHLKKEEDIAEKKEKLWELISKLPPKAVIISLETEEGPIKINIQPEMRLYLNGREEKQR